MGSRGGEANAAVAERRRVRSRRGEPLAGPIIRSSVTPPDVNMLTLRHSPAFACRYTLENQSAERTLGSAHCGIAFASLNLNYLTASRL